MKTSGSIFVVLGVWVFALPGCGKVPGSHGGSATRKTIAAQCLFLSNHLRAPLVPGTVTRDGLVMEDELTGAVVPVGAERNATVYAHPAESFPFPITRDDLQRGRAQFNIYCLPCHGETGDGHGMIVSRGLTPPPSYLLDRLRNAPVGHFYDVITHGYGAMYSYNERIVPADRWRIVAYIRALQLSQHADAATLPEEDRQKLQAIKDQEAQ